MDYQTGVTKKGWKVSVASMPHVESVCVGLWFPVGSRYESCKYAGASHFIEHMLFKGSKRRSAKEISQAVEGVGGYLNAFTAEEMTSYYASATVQHLPLILDVLLDMVFESTFPAAEIERERGVILEEIKMYEDQPSQLAQEGLNSLLWPDQSLGRPVTGSAASVSKMTRQELLRFKKDYYPPERMHITVAGKTNFQEVKDILDKRNTCRRGARSSHAKQIGFERARNGRTKAILIRNKPTEQTHLALGFRGLSRRNPRRYALKLASVILGENMSSRLFQKIREEHGLAYSIGSNVSFFTDTGIMVISAGLENKRALQACGMILKVAKSLAAKAPSQDELKRAKDYVIGQMWMGLENTTNQNMWMGEALMGYQRIHSPREMESRLQAVTAQHIREAMAQIVRQENLQCSIVAPEGSEKDWTKALDVL